MIASSDHTILDAYVDEIRQYPLLSREEEAVLGRQIREEQDPEAVEQLVRGNLRFVISVAKKYQNRGVPLVDLINEGNLGLLKAAEKFDPTQGVKFISYAVWWIREAIRTALAEQADVVRRPVARALESATSLSLDAPLNTDDENPLSLAELIPDAAAASPDSETMTESLNSVLRGALARLPQREREVLYLYYGFQSEPLTLEEIARVLGVSPERTRQIKDAALTRMRQMARRQLEPFRSE